MNSVRREITFDCEDAADDCDAPRYVQISESSTTSRQRDRVISSLLFLGSGVTGGLISLDFIFSELSSAAFRFFDCSHADCSTLVMISDDETFDSQ